MLCLKKFTVFICCVSFLIVQSGHGSEVIGGHEVKPHSLPFMARLKGNRGFCGGILISPSWVLTAAHCGEIEEVLLGAHNITAAERKSRQLRRVVQRFPHHDYNDAEKVNDLMLLKLEKSIEETKTVKCLLLGDSVKDPAAGTRCMVAGWGQTFHQHMSDVLMAANLTVVSRQKCQSDYTTHITDGMICAGSDGRDITGPGQGDSGGPLICNDFLVGVTSFGWPGSTCPGVFTFLSKEQLAWIHKTMNNRHVSYLPAC